MLWIPMLWIPMLQVGLLCRGVGRTTVTFLIPPHCVFLTDVPLEEQVHFCLQVEPSSMPYWNSNSTSNSTEISIVSMEKDETLLQDALGQLSSSGKALPVMLLLWKSRTVSWFCLAKELLHHVRVCISTSS
jgi:hypothetical protein